MLLGFPGLFYRSRTQELVKGIDGQNLQDLLKSNHNLKNMTALHRIPEILLREKISLRLAARRMGVTTCTAAKQIDCQYKMSLAELYLWREALRVPLTELLTVPLEGTHSVILERAQLIQIMKTVKTLEGKVNSEATKILTTRLIGQLMKLMPELDGVRPMPARGPFRTEYDIGKLSEQALSREFPDSLQSERYQSLD